MVFVLCGFTGRILLFFFLIAGVVAAVDIHNCQADIISTYHHRLWAYQNYSYHICHVTYLRAPTSGDYIFTVRYYDETTTNSNIHPGIILHWTNEWNLEIFYRRL